MTHLDFVPYKETLPRLGSPLNPLSKGLSFIILQECMRPLALARGDKKEACGDKKEKLEVRGREKEKFK
jgi:hypothetical protein